MLQRIEMMRPSTSNDEDSQLFRPQLVRHRPIRRKRNMNDVEGKSATSKESTSAIIRDETMELLPMPPRKRLRRAEKVYPPAQKDKTHDNDSVEPWWMRVQIGNESSGSFSSWQKNNNTAGMDELQRENGAFSMRSTSLTSIDSSCSEIVF